MGSGASAGVIAGMKACDPEELKEALAKMPTETREKLAAALSSTHCKEVAATPMVEVTGMDVTTKLEDWEGKFGGLGARLPTGDNQQPIPFVAERVRFDLQLSVWNEWKDGNPGEDGKGGVWTRNHGPTQFGGFTQTPFGHWYQNNASEPFRFDVSLVDESAPIFVTMHCSASNQNQTMKISALDASSGENLATFMEFQMRPEGKDRFFEGAFVVFKQTAPHVYYLMHSAEAGAFAHCGGFFVDDAATTEAPLWLTSGGKVVDESLIKHDSGKSLLVDTSFLTGHGKISNKSNSGITVTIGDEADTFDVSPGKDIEIVRRSFLFNIGQTEGPKPEDWEVGVGKSTFKPPLTLEEAKADVAKHGFKVKVENAKMEETFTLLLAFENLTKCPSVFIHEWESKGK